MGFLSPADPQHASVASLLRAVTAARMSGSVFHYTLSQQSNRAWTPVLFPKRRKD